MKNYTVRDTVVDRIYLSPPTEDCALWHLRLNGKRVKTERTLDAMYTRYMAELEARARGEGETAGRFNELYTQEEAEEALRSVREEGWPNSELSFFTEKDDPELSTLAWAGTTIKGTACLVHVAIPGPHLLQDGAGEAHQDGNGPVYNRYKPITQATGIKIFTSSEDNTEHLLRLVKGASFRVQRIAGPSAKLPWREAKFVWNGFELKLCPSRRGQQHVNQPHA